MKKSFFPFSFTRKFFKSKTQTLSAPIIKLSIMALAIGIIIMIVAMAILKGYQNAIKEKIFGAHTHIVISNYDQNNSFESCPILLDSNLIKTLQQHPNIKSIQISATKSTVLKTDDQVEGVVLKGIAPDYNFNYLKKHLKSGRLPHFNPDSTPSNDILISQKLAQKLNLKVNDKLRFYFIQDPPLQRRLTICGIYETGLSEFDEKFALVDLRHIQKLNGWTSQQIASYEIILNDINLLSETSEEIDLSVGNFLKAESIQKIYPQLFDWINLFDMNVRILFIITLIVCIVTIICCLLIIIIEKASTIGILKALGSNSKLILNIFIQISLIILTKGLIIGNSIAGLFCFLQNKYQFIKLNAETYYVSAVPVEWSWSAFAWINGLTVICCITILIIPAYLISRKINPIQAIKID